MSTRRALLLFGLSASVACSRQHGLLVFAAASLGPFLETMILQFQVPQPKAQVSLNLGGSATLARQLLAAPKGDVFLCAGREDIARLRDSGLLEGGRMRTLFENRLVLIANADSKLTPMGAVTALTRSTSILSVADPAAAPLGRYSRTWLETLRPGLWSELQKRLSPMPDARAALTQVERRSQALGIVYRSDAIHSPRVKVIAEADPHSGPKIEYIAGILKQRPNRASAEAFVAHLTGGQARDRYLQLGFLAPSPS